MILNQHYFRISSFIFLIIFISSSTATSSFCNDLTLDDDKSTPCFLESPVHNPVHLRTSGNSLVLPCHVARSKHATIEWWYQDFQKSINVKIHPVFPPVRPTALRFTTSVSPASENGDETDIIDVSILLRFVNVDDKGIYRCVIRSWGSERFKDQENDSEDIKDSPALVYHVDFTGPRVCQQSLGTLPCFTSMLTSSPTFIDAYQTTFLQCVVRTVNRPVTIFWVAGNASENSVLITDYLTKNQHNGDRLRRVFPLSPFDYSIELTIDRDIPERTYSCVIDGATDAETTLFTYIVRSAKIDSEKTIKSHHIETTTTIELETQTEISTNETEVLPDKTEQMTAHDALTAEQIDQLRKKTSHEHAEKKSKTEHNNDENDDVLSEFYAREDKSTRR